uniref:Uncharacterized protein n=1 Tax=Aegilops tauschii subsp. strangulata TaxID=200361 RepID=A0A453F6B7_AEGTS
MNCIVFCNISLYMVLVAFCFCNYKFTFMGIIESFLFPQGAVAVPFDSKDKELITKG